MTGQAIINRALRANRAIASGENPTPDESADSQTALNSMLGGWSIDRLNIFAITRQVFSLVDGQATRTLGLTGNFNVARPPRIEGAGLIDTTSSQAIEYPMEYTRDSSRWAEVTLKTNSSTLPMLIYDNDGFPLRTLTFYPVPIGTPQVALYTWTALTSFTDFTTDVTFPPGYEDAIFSNLAVRLAGEGLGELSPITAQIAIESLGRIKSANIVPVKMKCDPAILRAYTAMDIYSGF